MLNRRTNIRRRPSTGRGKRSAEQLVASLYPFSWLRADSYETSGGNVSAWVDRARAGHKMLSSDGAVAIPAVVSGTLGDKPVASFTGAQSYVSNASNQNDWTFLGNESTMFHVYRPNSFGDYAIFLETWSAGNGISFSLDNTGKFSGAVYRGVTGYGSDQMQDTLYTSHLYEMTVSASRVTTAASGLGTRAADVSGSPNTISGKGLQLSGRGGLYRMNGLWGETIIFNRALSEAEKNTVRDYIAARYGIENENARIVPLAPKHWFRADTLAGSTSAVTRIYNRTGADYLTVTGTLPQAASDPSFNGRQSLTFAGTQYAASNLAASAWTFLSNGSGSTIVAVFKSTTGGVLLANTTGGPLPNVELSVGANINYTIRNAFAGPYPVNHAVPYTSGTATYSIVHEGGGAFALSNGATVVAGTDTVAPVATNPNAVMTLGAYTNAGLPFSGSWCETMFFDRVLTEAEKRAVRRYIADRYGIDAHVGLIEDLVPKAWFTADSVTLSGTNVSKLNDRVSSDALTVTGTLPAGTPNTLLGGSPSITFTGSQRATSGLPASSWSFLHNGAGFEAFNVYVPNSTFNFAVMATRPGAAATETGLLLQSGYSSSQRVAVSNGSVNIFDFIGGTAPTLSTPTYLNVRYKEGDAEEYALSKLSVKAGGGLTGAAPSTFDPTGTFTLAATTSGAVAAQMQWADTIVFDRVLTDAERWKVREYIGKKYGIDAADAGLQKLAPRHWFRADDVTTSGPNVTTVRNRVGTDYLSVAGTVPLLSSNSALAGSPSLTFTGNQYAASNLPASAWKFMHDGSGVEAYVVHVPRGSYSTRAIISTQSGATPSTANVGVSFYQYGSGNSSVLVSSGIELYQEYNTTEVLDAASYRWYAHKTGNSPVLESGRVLTTTGASGGSGSPSSSNPTSTFTLGALNVTGAAAAYADVAEVVIFDRVLSSAERRSLREYMRARYGFNAVATPVHALKPRNWFRADAVTMSTSVTRVNNIVGDDYLTPTGTINQVGATTALNGAASLTFGGAQRMASNLPASSWRLLHDGTGSEQIHVYVPNVMTNFVVSATRGGFSAAEVGTFLMPAYSGIQRVSVGNGTVDIFDAVTGTASNPGTATFMDFAYKEGAAEEFQYWREATRYNGSNSALVPSAADPMGTFTIGAAVSGVAPAYMQWAETLVFDRVLTEAERNTVRDYVRLRYGINAVATPVYDLKPKHWFRSDAVRLSSTNVTHLDNVVGGDRLNVLGTLPQVASNSAFNGASTLTFSAAQNADSNLPAASWAFLHSGTGVDAFLVFAPDTTQANAMVATSPGSSTTQRGVVMSQLNGGGMRVFAGTGAATVFDANNVGSLANNVPTIMEYSYLEDGSSSEVNVRGGSTTFYSSATAAAPTSVDIAPLRLGATTDGSVAAKMAFAELIIFNRVLTGAERAKVRDYVAARYGIDAVSLPVSKLLPKAWYRADSAQVAGGNASKVYDRVDGVDTLNSYGTLSYAANAKANGKPTLGFSGSQYLLSQRAPSFFTFLHNGLGSDVFTVVVTPSTSSNNSTLFGTANISSVASVGAHSSWINDTGGMGYTIQNGTTRKQFLPTVRGFSDAMLAWFDHRHQETGTMAVGQNLMDFTYPPAAFTPNAAAPEFTLHVGATPGSGFYPANYAWAETLMFDRLLSATERAQVHRYLTGRYISELLGTAEAVFDADHVVLTGTDVLSLPNMVGTGSLVFPSGARPGAPVIPPGHTDRNIVFTGAQYAVSDEPASRWTFLHDGTGCTVCTVFEMTDLSTTSVFVSTRTGTQTGFTSYVAATSGTTSLYISNGATAAIGWGSGTVAGSPSYVLDTLTTANAEHYLKNSLASNGAPGSALSTGTPGMTLYLGADGAPGGAPNNPAKMRWRATYIWKRVLTSAERTALGAYIQASTGIAP